MSNKVFAQLYNDTVVQFINEVENIEEEWHPDVIATLVNVTEVHPQPEIGWVYNDGSFAPPVPFVPTTPDEKRQAALITGCEVHSTGEPTLNAKYIANGPTWQQMTNEVLYIVSFNQFSGGQTQVDWQTKEGTVTFTDKNDFKNVVQAIGDWLTGWNLFVSGSAETPPADVVTIA